MSPVAPVARSRMAQTTAAGLAGLLALVALPVAIGYGVDAYRGGAQRSFDRALRDADDRPDPVTALVWAPMAEGPLFVGTLSGRRMAFERDGQIAAPARLAEDGVGPVAAFLFGSDRVTAPVLVRHRAPALGDMPGDTTIPYGPETCKSGFVWRVAAPADLVCVPPASRDLAAADNAAAASRIRPGGARGLCAEGFVPRHAFASDDTCVLPATRDAVAEENRLDEARKVVAQAARIGTPRFTVAGIPAERGLAVVAGGMLIAGRPPPPVDTAPQGEKAIPAAPAAPGLTEWTLAETPPAEVGEIFGITDVRALAVLSGAPTVSKDEPLSGTSTIIAGDGAGGVFAIDATQQVSGVDPSQYRARIGGHGAAVTAIVAPSLPSDAVGRHVFATAAADGTLKVWEGSVNRAGRLMPLSPYLSADVAPAGRRWVREDLAVSGRWQDLAAMSPDGRRLVLADADGRLTLVELPPRGSTGSDVVQQPLSPDLVAPAVWAPDGSFIVTASRGGSLQVLNAATLTLEHRFAGSTAPVRMIAIDNSSTRVGSLSMGGDIDVYSLENRTLMKWRPSDVARPTAIAFTPDGAFLAIGDESGGAILRRFSDGAGVTPIRRMTTGTATTQIRLAERGRRIVLEADAEGAVEVYGLTGLRRLSAGTFGTGRSPLRLSLDGSHVVFRGPGTGLTVAPIDGAGPAENVASGSLLPRGFASDAGADRIAVVDASGTVEVFSAVPDETVAGRMPPIAPDGLRIAADGAVLLLREPSGALHLASLADGATGRAILRPLALGLRATAADVAPGGRFVAAAEGDGTIRVFDPAAPDDGFRIAGHGALVRALAFSPDGAMLASADIDGRLRLTDLARARLVAALPLAGLPAGPAPALMAPRTIEALPPDSGSTGTGF